jgi:cellulose synthase/poly-beta-1,6-N-acetylglucosamine synthase-like glycosyltransferase
LDIQEISDGLKNPYILDWTIYSLIISYFIFLILLIQAWNGLKEPEITEVNFPFVSVLIPVRNEAPNLPGLIQCLENQTFAPDKFEVIFIDDNSDDNTFEYLMGLSKSSTVNIRVYKLEVDHTDDISHKKAAISCGVTKSAGEIILLTDGDVLFGKYWIQSIANAFLRTASKFISGPVVMNSNSFIDEIQSIEFSSLIGAGAAAIYYKNPVLCNGANLAFKRDAFIEVNGYEGFEEIISGDDEFLMYKIRKLYPSKIFFLKSDKAIVHIQPKSSLTEFYHQRRRWSGKWRKHPNPLSKVLATYIFTVHLSFLLVIILFTLKLVPLYSVIILFMIKLLLELMYFKQMYLFFIKKLKTFPFIISSLIYPVYAVTFGILSNMGGYKWKGRYYKN